MRQAKFKVSEAATLRSVCDFLDKTNQVWLRHSPSNVVGKKGAATFRRIRDSQKGAPDVIWFRPEQWATDNLSSFCFPVAIEVKSPTGKQSEHQKTWEATFRSVGGEYWLIRSVDEFLGRVK